MCVCVCWISCKLASGHAEAGSATATAAAAAVLLLFCCCSTAAAVELQHCREGAKGVGGDELGTVSRTTFLMSFVETETCWVDATFPPLLHRTVSTVWFAKGSLRTLHTRAHTHRHRRTHTHTHTHTPGAAQCWRVLRSFFLFFFWFPFPLLLLLSLSPKLSSN